LAVLRFSNFVRELHREIARLLAAQNAIDIGGGATVDERLYPIDVSAGPTKVDPDVAALGLPQFRKRLSERRDHSLPLRIVFVVPQCAARGRLAAPLPRALLQPERHGTTCWCDQSGRMAIRSSMSGLVGRFWGWRWL
jgi:hypothetical protein